MKNYILKLSLNFWNLVVKSKKKILTKFFKNNKSFMVLKILKFAINRVNLAQNYKSF